MEKQLGLKKTESGLRYNSFKEEKEKQLENSFRTL
jgi:hypothetical protein